MPRAKSKKLKCHTCGAPLDPNPALWDQDALAKEAFCGTCYTNNMVEAKPAVPDPTKWGCPLCGELMTKEGMVAVEHFKQHYRDVGLIP
jgi:hypothetical protein